MDIGVFITVDNDGWRVPAAFGQRIQPLMQCRKDRLPAAA